MFLIEDIIDLAIQIEQNAEKVYRKELKRVSNSSLTSVVTWLTNEEVNHVKWFYEMRKNIRKNVVDSNVEKMGKALLSEVVGSQSFSLQARKFSSIHNLNDLLSLAIEFETDKVIFYQLLRPFIDDEETLDFLNSTITRENQHIERLQLYLDSDVEESAIVSEGLCY